jgi:hypothetical protein
MRFLIGDNWFLLLRVIFLLWNRVIGKLFKKLFRLNYILLKVIFDNVIIVIINNSYINIEIDNEK